MFASPSLMLSEIAFFRPGASTQRADVSAHQALVAVFFFRPVAHATGRGCAGLPALTTMRNFKTREREIYGGIGKPRNRNPSLTRFEVASFVHDVPSPPIHLRIWFVVRRLHLVANELGERAG
jgi:hypothetical protein